MQITVTETDDIRIASLEGDLDTATSPEALEILSGVVEQGSAKILLDLEQMNYISSAGLRVLLMLARQTGAAGGELRICGLNDMAREVFDISGFSSILAVFPNRSDALDKF